MGELHRRYGASLDCLYLIRPDGYIAFRSQPVDTEALRSYLRRIFTRGSWGTTARPHRQASKKAGWVLDGAIELAESIAVTDDLKSPEVEAARAEVMRLRALPGSSPRVPVGV